MPGKQYEAAGIDNYQPKAVTRTATVTVAAAAVAAGVAATRRASAMATAKVTACSRDSNCNTTTSAMVTAMVAMVAGTFLGVANLHELREGNCQIEYVFCCTYNGVNIPRIIYLDK